MKPVPNEIGHFAADKSQVTKSAADGENIQDLMADALVLLERMSHVADPEIAILREKVAETLETARRVVRQGTRQVKRQARDAIRTGDAYVRDRPWQMVGVAAAAGLLVGLLVHRRVRTLS